MLAALFWSLDGLFFRPQFYSLPAGLVVFWEHFLGFVVLSPFIFLSWKKVRTLSLKSWQALGWVSLFGGLVGTLMITKAFFAAIGGQTSFATVIILQKLQPFFALVLARAVLGEKLSRRFYIWAGIALVASYLLAFSDSGLGLRTVDWTHDAALFALIAAFAFGSSTVFGKRIANHLDFRAVAALRFGITAIMAFIFVIFTGTLGDTSLITRAQAGYFALIVLTSGAGAMFLYYYGLRRVSASAATVLELFWPFSALVLDYFVNGNKLTPIQIAAVGILLIAFFQVSATDKPAPASFKGKVIHGAGRGRRIGYRTANLDATDLDIPHGIYVVKISVRDIKRDGLMHFGFRDVYDEPVSLEILVKDFQGDIYGEEMTVTVVRKIREVKNFPDTATLVRAIEEDLKQIA